MFGMGTGVTPPARPPGISEELYHWLIESCDHCGAFPHRQWLNESIVNFFEDHVYQEQRNAKPHGRLVLVSYGPHEPSTPSLSNSSSTSVL